MLQTVIKKSIPFEKRHTVEEQEGETAIKVFVLQMINTAVM